jgi:hypothetical protein
MTMRKVWIGIAGAAALLVLGAGGYMAVTDAGGFDSDQWKAQRFSTARDNPRSHMVGQLKDVLRPGMTKPEVVELLGEPETKDAKRYTYALGTSAFGVDYEYLVVEFDDNERVVRHMITRG